MLGSGDGGEEADKNDVDCLVECGQFLTGWPLAHCELHTYGTVTEALMMMIGTEIAKMHIADIVHGDLTTSNLML